MVIKLYYPIYLFPCGITTEARTHELSRVPRYCLKLVILLYFYIILLLTFYVIFNKVK